MDCIRAWRKRRGALWTLILVVMPQLWGCASSWEAGHRAVTMNEILELRNQEALLPMTADSVAARFATYDRRTFATDFGTEVREAVLLIDSLNTCLPAACRIDTLSIDHTFENIGTAARVGGTIYLSSSLFYLYPDATVARSALFHEFGHMLYNALPADAREEVGEIWEHLLRASLLYLFRDGEYSNNARFGGHPYDSPSELFSSAFNLFHNNIDELDVRLRYVQDVHYGTIRRLLEIVLLER